MFIYYSKRKLILRCLAIVAMATNACLLNNWASAYPPQQASQLTRFVWTENVAEAKQLLRRGADANAKDDDGFTPLCLAAQSGNVQIVALLLDHGADPNLASANGNTPLVYASGHGYTSIVKRLLAAGADPNAPGQEGTTGLIEAAFNNQPETVKVLLKAGADVNAQSNGQTALMLVPFNVKGIVEKLLNAGAKLELRDQDGRTALFYAVMWHKPDKLKLLLDHGARFDIVDKDGISPLALARKYAEIGRPDRPTAVYIKVYDLLVEAGAR